MNDNVYCTYLTTYKGNKLPPFYIGSSTIKRVKSGYNGSVSSEKYKQIWNSEQKLNNHLFNTTILTTHVNRQEALNKENMFHLTLNVTKNPLYINMSNAIPNGKFGRRPKGYLVSEETRERMRTAKTVSIREKYSRLRKGLVPHKGKLIPQNDYWSSEELIEEKKNVKNMRVWHNILKQHVIVTGKEYQDNRHKYTSLNKGKVFVEENGVTKLVTEQYQIDNDLKKTGIHHGTITVRRISDNEYIRIHRDDYDPQYHSYVLKGRIDVLDIKDMKLKKIQSAQRDVSRHIDAPFWIKSRYYKNIDRLKDIYPLYTVWKENSKLSTYKLENIRKKDYPDLKYNFSETTTNEFRNGYNPFNDDLLEQYIKSNML